MIYFDTIEKSLLAVCFVAVSAGAEAICNNAILHGPYAV